MSMPLKSSPRLVTPSDWMRGALVWGLIPGWIISMIFHAGLLAGGVLLSRMESCRGDYSGENGTGFREVGLKSRESSDSSGPAGDSPAPAGESLATPITPVITQPPVAPAVDGPPVPLSLPNASHRPLLGKGPPALGSSTLPAATLPATGQVTGGGVPGARGTGDGDGGNGVGQTSLFGVNDAGKKFIYVIDRSFSMDEYGAYAAARTELLTSLSRLTEVQQFQIILYNNAPLVLETRDNRYPMFFGTDAQRLLVREQIRSIPPDGGTRHLPALEAALKYNPDVLFFLTDGAEPALDASELQALRAKNRQGTRIHCIEFGHGPQIVGIDGKPVGNFLMKLANENSGKYTYRDVKRFSSTP